MGVGEDGIVEDTIQSNVKGRLMNTSILSTSSSYGSIYC